MHPTVGTLLGKHALSNGEIGTEQLELQQNSFIQSIFKARVIISTDNSKRKLKCKKVRSCTETQLYSKK